MPRKSKSSKWPSDRPLPAIANMRFWSRFTNPPPMLAFAFAEPADGRDVAAEVLKRFPSVNADASLVYSIRISLDNAKPSVWRRVLVNSLNLETLHHVIQIVMGWNDSHLHGFDVCNVRVPLVEDGASIDERGISIAQLQAVGIKKFRYTYDFGDDWKHTIHIESATVAPTNTVYPQCVAGKGACPLEDVGGVWHWSRLLEAVQHPDRGPDGEVESLLERVGKGFTPPSFDVEKANASLQRRSTGEPASTSARECPPSLSTGQQLLFERLQDFAD